MRWISGGLMVAALAALTTPVVAQRVDARGAESGRAEALRAREMAREMSASVAPLAAMAAGDASLQARELAQIDASSMRLAYRARGMRDVALELAYGVDRLAPRAAPSYLTEAPAASLQGDPGDSIYRVARESLNRGRFRDAATQFHTLRQRYPKSGYAADAMYWEAFALYREGGTDRLRQARNVLDAQLKDYPDASTSGDAATLAVRVRGELARMGDNSAAAAIAAEASAAAEAPEPPEPPATAYMRGTAPSAPRPPRGVGATGRVRLMSGSRDCGGDDESDIKIAAINGLMQMDADRAVPILKQVLARRDSGSVCLRRKAVFLISQKQTEGTEDILLDAARNDPDPEVKQQAVFWLSQVGTEKAVSALDSILRRSDDSQLQQKAIFALAQQGSSRAVAALRAFAEREDVSDDLREKAVFWLGQSGAAENAQFLRGMYTRTRNVGLKQKILFSLAQAGGKENQDFLLGIARNKSEDLEARKQALFWAGQSGTVSTADLAGIYATMPDREMREQVIFVLSQRNDAAAMDKLIDIARHEPDQELRKRAIFWVGQSKDPRAAQLLQDILTDK